LILAIALGKPPAEFPNTYGKFGHIKVLVFSSGCWEIPAGPLDIGAIELSAMSLVSRDCG